MANERRIVNKPIKKPIEDIDVNAENITVKVPTIEERVTAMESYLASADPYIRSTAQIENIKKQIAILNEEITRIAGVQSRANSYLDNKFTQIDGIISDIATIVKKHDDDYKELMSDIEDTEEDQPVEDKPAE